MNQSVINSSAKQSYTAEEIQAWLVSNISEMLGVEADEIDIREPLDSYGLDSAQGMVITSRAEKLFGFKMSLILLWHYPTIEALSKRLAEELVDSESFEI
ncbi:MAG: acyl carrier protein [Pelatocladus maniniholoensis HA4357-MV3]|jgi:acyl carrier protein|uniref:Acyl carrier protein n=1 Tax=Pelatocladus maniniholoensis HA4357-MV3 TaxID=1117104 RepID=A0A9E3HA73_9NOST|nr:acyl carrier protein [Pelatocladus maniniholoensis HA4357-MV3]BAZ66520.1 phosphopantetheine-binding protein [Fischerella sp. NIES-4106]